MSAREAAANESRARESLATAAETLGACVSLAPEVARAAALVSGALADGKRVLTIGNGGSAADAEHVAAELAGRFRIERRALDAVSLAANTSLVTAVSNDYGYTEVFARQVEAHGRAGDVLCAFTTSGRSPNVLRAIEVARARGLVVIGFAAAGARTFGDSCDAALLVPSGDVPRIQEAHIALAHVLCELVEAELFGEADG